MHDRCTAWTSRRPSTGSASYIGLERVHPILVLFPATADVASFEQQLDAHRRPCGDASSRVVSCRQEEEFLLKYSGRGRVQRSEARLSKVAKGLEGSYRDEWQAKTREWANVLAQGRLPLAPIWSRKTGITSRTSPRAIATCWRRTALSMPRDENPGGPLNNVEFENCRQAAKKNIDPPAAWKYGDLLGVLTTDGTMRPRVPRCFFALLQELRTQSAVTKLANSFFFAVPDSEMKAAQQLEQILEVLIGIGLVRKKNDLYKAVDRTMLESPTPVGFDLARRTSARTRSRRSTTSSPRRPASS